MPIPCRFNPMGKSNKPQAFELVVKPGILATDMTYGFTPYWNTGGYCSVDWGDGSKEDAVTNKTKLNHTYAVAGTYKIRIKAECYNVRCGSDLLYDCSENWDSLGDITGLNGSVMMTFDYATNLVHSFKTLPRNLQYASYMFRSCYNADFMMTSLPVGLVSVYCMFENCSKATIPFLTSLPEGLTNGNSMFYGCKNALLPLTKLPDSLSSADGMFMYCNKANFEFTKLPDSLQNGAYMFQDCLLAKLPLTNLSAGLTSGRNMFFGCKNAEINLDTLVANAPAEGWTALTTIQNMFNGCSKVTGSRSAFLAKCPNVTNTNNAFNGTNTTE